MSSASGDLTQKSRIRRVATQLFAERGFVGVTVRQIAEAADVSPALVVHHYGSKQGLWDAAVAEVTAVLDGFLDLLSAHDAAEQLAVDMAGGLHDLVGKIDPTHPSLTAFLRRLIFDDDPAGAAILRRMYDATLAAVNGWADAGLIDAGDDPELRAAVLMSHDMGMFLLRDRFTDLTGLDPLSAEGMGRWADETAAIYTGMWRTPSTHPDSTQEMT